MGTEGQEIENIEAEAQADIEETETLRDAYRKASKPEPRKRRAAREDDDDTDDDDADDANAGRSSSRRAREAALEDGKDRDGDDEPPKAKRDGDADDDDDADEDLGDDEDDDEVEDDEEDEGEDDEDDEESGVAPSNLPKGVKRHWKSIPKEARDGFVSYQKEMNNRMTLQGREITMFAPLKRMLAAAAQQNPNISRMTMDQVAQEQFLLYQVGQKLLENPTETLLHLARHYKVGDTLAKALTGDPKQNTAPQPQQGAQVVTDLQRRIAALQRQVESSANPENIRRVVAATQAQDRLEGAVNAFVKEASHWKKLEGLMPAYIVAARRILGEDADPVDVLKRGYKMAVRDHNLNPAPKKAKTKPTSSEDSETEDSSDPDREVAARAKRAKAANIKESGAGKPRKLEGDDSLRAAYRRANRR